ncbi:GAF domain-containing protein [Lentzea flaviverrucosa]|uniref:GAF domain-containing protein n=1 Tax=Lentzea flaviverrucosa TaxID=200379 RepID=A0A1H9GTV3_9PSEU|nr:GAF domain-containing protein [Lentzea flaviverrucosa]RDI34802.1 GAF domain-containing protein [Lentzea flaviverrucosa]SEQ53438.1 GAF domain-containing protein [Lentzea flaviverrucosa]
MPGPQEQIAVTLSELTASLVGRHDAESVLRLVTAACENLLSASSTGVLMADPRGGLSVVSASDEQARFLELLQSRIDEGPCVDCVRHDTTIACPDLEDEHGRWPAFTRAALGAGFRAVHAVPMRLAGGAVGGLNVFYTAVTPWEEWQQRLGQVLGDLAVLGLSQDDDPARTQRLAEQTLTTLNDRVMLAHAIGMVAGALDIGTDEARRLIFGYAATLGSPVRDVSRLLTSGNLEVAELAAS